MWTVSPAHSPLAEGLISRGINNNPRTTHILTLTSDYESVFANFNATIRNEVRAAHRRGVVVKEVRDIETIGRYYEIYQHLAEVKKFETVYPFRLFTELNVINRGVKFLVATYNEKVISGGIFFFSGSACTYWNGTADREYSNVFPTRAVIDHAIRLACADGVSFFDFGASAGIRSLENFKESWGAVREPYWEFHWSNPMWTSLSSVKRKILSVR